MATGSGKVLLCFDNLVDRATSLVASSAAVGALVANLQDYRPKAQWVATNNTPYVRASTGVKEQVALGIVWNHNGTTAGSIRLRGGEDAAFGSAIVDQTFDMWAPVYGLGEGGLGDNGLGGYPLIDARFAWSPYRVLLLPNAARATYWRLDFLDPLNAANFRAGRLFLGSYAQPSRNFSNDWSIGYERDGGHKITSGGSVRKNIKGQRRILTINFRFIKESEAWSTFEDLQRMVGITGDLFVILFPDGTPSFQYKTTIYGSPTVNGPPKGEGQNAPKSYSFSLTVREYT